MMKNPQANAILEHLHQVLAQMLRTSELDMAETITPDDVNFFLDNVAWAICSRLHIPVFRYLFFGPKKPFLPGFLRISFFSCVFRRNFSQERGFGGGRRNSCFLLLSQDFFAGISVGQTFLYLLRIPLDSSGFLWIPVPAKRCLALASD